MFNISFPLAFFAGLVSFFAPCVIPLLPAYLAYVTGLSVKDLEEGGFAHYRLRITISSIFYVLGFSVVFVLLGTAAGGIGQALREHSEIVRIASGILVIIFGANFAGFLELPILMQEKKFNLPSWTVSLGYGRAFLVGVIFASAWTPCIGVVLGSILALAASTSQNPLAGASLLFIYSLGISIPFLAFAVTLAQAQKYLKFMNSHLGTMSRISGIIFILFGVLLLTGTYKYVNGFLFDLAFKLGYEIK